jgi:hypothetical protein
MPLLRRLATPHAELLIQLARTGAYPHIQSLACQPGWIPPHDRFTGLRVIAGRWTGDAVAEAQSNAAARKLQAIAHLGITADVARAVLCNVDRGPPETRIALLLDDSGFAGFDTGGWRIRVLRDRKIAELAWGGGPSELKEQRRRTEDLLARFSLAVQPVKQIDLGG